MAEKSMTPRTDAKQFDSRYRNTQAKVVYALFARTLERENASLRLRLQFFEKMIDHHWNGVVGSGSQTTWQLAGDYRRKIALMQGPTFYEAIDAALDQSKRTEAVK